MKRLPPQVRIILGRVFLLWSFIVAGLGISSGVAFWLLNAQWVTSDLAGEILVLSWFVLSLIACITCLITWIN